MSIDQHFHYLLFKRAFDILFSAAVLIFAFPLFLAVAFMVKLTSKGPAFYCCQRLGLNGSEFKFWKFRSMHVDADARIDQLLKDHPELMQEWETYRKLKNDPRLTPIGKFLRATSLDEFPQFWNVLVGDLSLVGPRPYLPREKEQIHRLIGAQIVKMLSVRPGLTGIWQTSGRSSLTFEQRLHLDLIYVEKRSILFDLQLIAKTVPILLFSRGAY